MKVPSHRWPATVEFYEHTLSLPVLSRDTDSVSFEFGAQRLWIDRVPYLSQAEVWLEVIADDVAEAAAQLQEQGIRRCDAVEPLPPDFEGFWIVNPADVVHLVAKTS